MKLIKENWHWGITVAWIFFIFYLWQFSGITKPKDLNSVGDFLAGAFAPLAFFWLVSGYYQQSKGLEQNSEALKIQAEELQRSTEALQLQANELANSVQEQKNLIKNGNPNLFANLSEKYGWEVEPELVTVFTTEDKPKKKRKKK